MIKKTVDINPHASVSNKPETPAAGVYNGKIVAARVEDTPWGGQRLILAVDITEGEYAGRYNEIFEWEKKNSNYQARWKGTFRQNIPTGDGSEKDDWTQTSLEGTVWAIEESNPGYKFDWDEKSLVGKQVGLNIRNKEWSFNDMTGWTTEVGRLESLKEIAAGHVKVMKDKALSTNPVTAPADAQAGFTAVETSELPF